MSGSSMRRFWDSRAEDDPHHYIDSRQAYGSPDHARFWADGERDLAALLNAAGVTVSGRDTVVEIGCGIGRLTRPLAAGAARVLALDVSERMIDRARAENPELANVEWIVGDGVSLAGVADSSADGCISWVVFQHIPEPGVILGYVREMGRVLRPGGWAAFQVSTDPAVHRRPGPLSALLARLTGRAAPGASDPAWRGCAVRIDEVERAARDGGMEIESTAFEGTQYCVIRARRGPGSAIEQPAEPDAGAPE